MRRRAFIAGLGSAVALPLATRAQQGERVRRIGVLMPNDENDPVEKTFVSAFTQALADLGWTDGRNVGMDLRGFDINPIRALAKELVSLQPDVIVTYGTAATTAVLRETRTIPIVFANVGDPVARGFVPALNRPAGNTTGFAWFEPSIGGKWLELLSEIAPGLKRAAFMFNPDPKLASAYMPSFEAAARSLKVVPIITPVHDDVEIETAIIGLGREPGGGLLTPDAFTTVHRASMASPRSNPTTNRLITKSDRLRLAVRIDMHAKLHEKASALGVGAKWSDSDGYTKGKAGTSEDTRGRILRRRDPSRGEIKFREGRLSVAKRARMRFPVAAGSKP